MLQLYLTISCLSAILAGVVLGSDHSLAELQTTANTRRFQLNMRCPVVDCAFMFCPSGQYTQNYMTINGAKCPSCRTCDLTSLLSVRQLQAVFQMPCPIVDCMYLACPSGHYKQNYMTFNGKQCPSCASCVDSAQVVRQIASDLIECPRYHCKMPRCLNGQLREGYTIVNGHECPSCPICTEIVVLKRVQIEVDEQVDATCPNPMCVASESCNHAHLVDSFFKFRGHECPGCSVCEKNNENAD